VDPGHVGRCRGPGVSYVRRAQAGPAARLWAWAWLSFFASLIVSGWQGWPALTLAHASGTAFPALLLADDEDKLRQLTARVLRHRGFRVIEAGGGSEAVERFREHRDEIALVLLDVTMPELDGLAVLERIRALAPAVPAILMSELLEVDESLLSADHTEFAPKPYDLDEIAKTIRKLLDETA
jgi:CheY-like chemotaxis protein